MSRCSSPLLLRGGWRGGACAHSRPDGCLHSYQQTCTQTPGNKLVQARENDFTPLIKHGYMTDIWLRVHLLNITHTHTHTHTQAVGWAGRYSALTFKPHVWWIIKPKHNAAQLLVVSRNTTGWMRSKNSPRLLYWDDWECFCSGFLLLPSRFCILFMPSFSCYSCDCIPFSSPAHTLSHRCWRCRG